MDGKEFLEAVKAGDLEEVRQGLQLDRALADARDEEGLSPVLLAVYHGRSEVARLLAGDGNALDLHEAAALGVSPRVRGLLVEDPASVKSYSADGWTALHLAAFSGHADAVSILLDAGADTEARAHNRQDNTPLHAATAGLKNAVVIRLVARGADVNARNGQGQTPLHLAAYAGEWV